MGHELQDGPAVGLGEGPEQRMRRAMSRTFVQLPVFAKGFIYKGFYTGQYCVSDEAWVDVPPGAPCPDCGRITETVSEEDFLFQTVCF